MSKFKQKTIVREEADTIQPNNSYQINYGHYGHIFKLMKLPYFQLSTH